jgi:hypothetical protein
VPEFGAAVRPAARRSRAERVQEELKAPRMGRQERLLVRMARGSPARAPLEGYVSPSTT